RPFIPHGHDLTHDIIFFLRQHSFTAEISAIHTIPKLDTTLEEVMGSQWHHKYRKKLAKNKEIFVHQCINYQGNRLAAWQEIIFPNQQPNKCKSKWYIDLQNNTAILQIIQNKSRQQ